MSKHMIIDGYNLLGVTSRVGSGGRRESEASREGLIQELILYRHRVGHAITVVFDAWKQLGETQHHEHRTGVTVVFTRQGEQADQVIQRMAREQGRSCVVVSSDHEIINTAHTHGAMVLRSQEFLSKLRHGALRPSSRESVQSREDDALNVQRRPDKKGNPRKLPKAARRRLRSLKKF